MKTKRTKRIEGLPSRPEQSHTDPASPVPPLDFERRYHNRNLPTAEVLALLRSEVPRFYELAEVVGTWVWIQFADRQPPEVTRALAQLGFHWNSKRQLWQHPCGPVTVDASPADPRAKYGAHRAAELQPA